MKIPRISGTLITLITLIGACFALSAGVEAHAARFEDVPGDAPYAQAAEFVTDSGWMDAGGLSGELFVPDGLITGAECLEILHRVRGRPDAATESLTQTLPPEEIPGDSDERAAAAWAAGQGMLSGYDASVFHAADAVSRGYLFFLLHRMIGGPALNNPVKAPFADELSAPAVFEMPIRWARESEIIPRFDGNRLRPGETVTRAYLAAVLQNFLTVYPAGMPETTGETSGTADETSGTHTQTTAYSGLYQPFQLSKVLFPAVPARPQVNGFMNWEERNAYRAALTEWRQAHFVDAKLTAGMDSFFTAAAKEFLSGDGTENKVCSPLNLYVALGMLADVTGGNSQKQVLSLMGAKSVTEVRERVQALWAADYHDDETNTCALGNSFWMNQPWLDEHGALKQSATDSLSKNFYASAFAGDAEESAYNQAFQAWINEQTGAQLAEQVAGMELSPDMVLTLVSAINFRAGWIDEFDDYRNVTGKFYTKSGQIECEFMRETGDYYYTGKRFGAVSKPLSHGGDMWFILPDKGTAPEKLLEEKEFARFAFDDPEKFRYQSKADTLYVHETIPKFDISSSIDLLEGLKRLGVTDVFDWTTADFTPLWEPEKLSDAGMSLYVSKADHDACIAIDEEGCRAAAVTRIELSLGGAAPGEPTTETIEFIVDRPFLVMVTDANSLPLFMATVNCPVE